MSWKMYRWVWHLRSPLHVGLTPAGSLNRTRLYIPARSMWAALTAEVARRDTNTSFPEYDKIGRELQEKARFTYLYPAKKVSANWLAWLPCYDEQTGLCWLRESDKDNKQHHRRFRQRLLYTRPSTAIAAGTGAAQDGSLHEVEYIQTRWRDSMSHMAFVGYLFLKEGIESNIENALKQIKEIYIGGETRYGFGHLLLDPYPSQFPWEETTCCFGLDVDLTRADPVVKGPSYLLAHALRNGGIEKGSWEMLVWWDRENLVHDSNALLWAPGSTVEQGASFAILGCGLWRREEGTP